MKVKAILEKKGSEVVTVEPEMKIPAAAAHMRLKNIAALVVMKNGRMVGMISERDIVAAMVRFGNDFFHHSVADIMSEPVTCTPEDGYQHVMHLMTQHRIRHLPVVEQDRLMGIISIGDVVKRRLEELELEAGVRHDAFLTHH